MFVSCECCVLSGRGLCVGLITCSEESYRLWCVCVCSRILDEAVAHQGCCAMVKKKCYIGEQITFQRVLKLCQITSLYIRDAGCFSQPHQTATKLTDRYSAYRYNPRVSDIRINYTGTAILQVSPTRCTVLLNVFISLLYVFRAAICPSSGENYCIYATLVFATLYGWPPTQSGKYQCRTDTVILS